MLASQEEMLRHGLGEALGNVQRRMHGCQIACKFQGEPALEAGATQFPQLQFF